MGVPRDAQRQRPEADCCPPGTRAPRTNRRPAHRTGTARRLRRFQTTSTVAWPPIASASTDRVTERGLAAAAAAAWVRCRSRCPDGPPSEAAKPKLRTTAVKVIGWPATGAAGWAVRPVTTRSGTLLGRPPATRRSTGCSVRCFRDSAGPIREGADVMRTRLRRRRVSGPPGSTRRGPGWGWSRTGRRPARAGQLAGMTIDVQAERGGPAAGSRSPDFLPLP